MSVNTAAIAPAVLLMAEDNGIQTSYNVDIYSGAVGALVDPVNINAGNARIAQINNTDGHIREIRIDWKQRQVASAVVEAKNCEVGPQIPYFEETVPVNQYKGISFSMSEATVREFLSSTTELVRLTGVSDPGQIIQVAGGLGAAQSPLSVAREIFKDFIYSSNALVQAIDQEVVASIVAGAGNWITGNATETYAVQAADGSAAPAGLFEMKQNIMVSGFRGTPIVIGGAGAFHRVYMNDSRYFGQAANGLNYSTVRTDLGVAGFYYSENIAGAMSNQDSALVLMPGQVIFLPYLNYKGNFGKIGNMFRFTMPLPGVPNLQVDVRILPDECEENYAVWMELYFDTFVAPTTLFASGDNLDGINGVYQAQLTQAS